MRFFFKFCEVTYLDCSSGDVSIVRETSCEGWSIIESEFRLTLAEFELLLESLDFVPEFEDVFFLLGEIGSVGD